MLIENYLYASSIKRYQREQYRLLLVYHQQEERADVHKLGVRVGPGTSQKRATIKKWPGIWDNHTTTAQWTTKLIPNIAKCLECTHRRVDYTLTQFLTGNGTYGVYVKRRGRKEDSSCRYCHLTLAKK